MAAWRIASFLEPLQALFGHTLAGIPDSEKHLRPCLGSRDHDLSRNAVLKAMDDSVLHQRLEHQLGYPHIQQGIVHFRPVRKLPGKADFLNLHIPLQQPQLFLQTDELVGGDAAPQDLRQVGGNRGYLRNSVDLPHPLQCVQGVVQKVGVQLSLHHTDLGVAKLLLLADGLRQVRFQPLSHPVEAARQLAQLINACDIHPHIQVAALYRFHGAVEPADRPEQLAAEAHGNHQAQSQTQYNRNRRHHVQKPHDPVRHGFRLAE